MRFIKRILERGTVTVPRDVREALGVSEGDIVEFEIVSIVRKSEDKPMTPDTDEKSTTGATPTRLTAKIVRGTPQ